MVVFGLSSLGDTGTQYQSEQEQLEHFEKRHNKISWEQENQRLNQLVIREEKYSLSPHFVDYLGRQPGITWLSRAIVINWMMQLASQLQCRREAFSNATNLLDRYLGICAPFPLCQLQLLGATCLLIAQKLEDNQRITANSFCEPINEKHSLEQLLDLEVSVAIRLKFKLQAPTVHTWANRLCAQWDLYASSKGNSSFGTVRFKSGTQESYINFRWIAQYIDFALLDIRTLQYKNRTLAAAFLYLTILLRLQQHSSQEVATSFKLHSQPILAETPFNCYFSQFLEDSFGFPLQDILPAVQYCSSFVILELDFETPNVQTDRPMTLEQYCAIQTFNKSNRYALSKLDRSFW